MKKCQQQVPADYPPRMPNCPESWTAVKSYAPTNFTASIVYQNSTDNKPGGWADPINMTNESLKRRFEEIPAKRNKKLSKVPEDGVVTFDGTTFRCPYPTGMTGRGVLGKFGPNYAADPLVTRDHESGMQVLLVTRADGSLALPGGMVEKGKSVPQTLYDEFTEEAVEDGPAVEKLFNECGQGVVYDGFVDDTRNTDNAWMETLVKHYHATPEIAAKLELCTTDKSEGILGVKWYTIKSLKDEDMFASHIDWIRKVDSGK